MTRREFGWKLRAVADDFAREYGNELPAALYSLDASDHLHVDLLMPDLLGPPHPLQEFVDHALKVRGAEMAAIVMSANSTVGNDSDFVEEGIVSGSIRVGDVAQDSLMLLVADEEGSDLHVAAVSEDEIWGDVTVEWGSWSDVDADTLKRRVGLPLEFRIPKNAEISPSN